MDSRQTSSQGEIRIRCASGDTHNGIRLIEARQRFRSKRGLGILFVRARASSTRPTTWVGPGLRKLSMLKAKGSWRHARHLVETPAEVALVGESSRKGDVNKRKVCAHEQLLRTQ